MVDTMSPTQLLNLHEDSEDHSLWVKSSWTGSILTCCLWKGKEGSQSSHSSSIRSWSGNLSPLF